MALAAFPTVRASQLRGRSVGNLLRMGHCAPTVMQTVVDASSTEAKWLVRLTAGLPGGIGNTRGECGALNGPPGSHRAQARPRGLGLALGEIERSRLRVLRMIATMAVGGDASADHLNTFNPVMNLGHNLAKWFKGEFGSTQCRALTRCDFGSRANVRDYIASDGTARCTRTARRVAARVAEMVERQSVAS